MDTFLNLKYIHKEHGGLEYLTDHGTWKASELEVYHRLLKDKLFVDAAVDETADIAICAFISELSKDCFTTLFVTLEVKMGNYIIIGILVVIVVVGVVYTIKHFKGESGCCGGGSYKPKRKKLAKVLYQKIFKVDGMHCQHCKNRVEEVVNDIKGIAGKVDLKKGELTVSYAEDVADEIIKARIERAGYEVISK